MLGVPRHQTLGEGWLGTGFMLSSDEGLLNRCLYSHSSCLSSWPEPAWISCSADTLAILPVGGL